MPKWLPLGRCKIFSGRTSNASTIPGTTQNTSRKSNTISKTSHDIPHARFLNRCLDAFWLSAPAEISSDGTRYSQDAMHHPRQEVRIFKYKCRKWSCVQYNYFLSIRWPWSYRSPWLLEEARSYASLHLHNFFGNRIEEGFQRSSINFIGVQSPQHPLQVHVLRVLWASS